MGWLWEEWVERWLRCWGLDGEEGTIVGIDGELGVCMVQSVV